MVAFKASQLTAFLRAPDPRFTAALFYGPDPSLVAEQASALARRIARRSEPAGEIVRVDDRDLAEDPGRLAVEVRTASMFSGGKVVRAAAGQRLGADVIEALLGEDGLAFLIVEAGNLRPAAPLRTLFEKASRAAALPCYELGSRDMGAFIDAELMALSATITAQARGELIAQFGGDPARARAELGKLALYVGDGGRIGIEEIDAVVGDVSQAGFDALSNAAAGRKVAEALRQLDRLLAAGQSAQAAISAITRHFERLHRLCAAREAGVSLAEALARFRPPLHFRQKDALEAHARLWSRGAAERALALIAEAARTARRRPEAERQLAERLLISLGQPETQ